MHRPQPLPHSLQLEDSLIVLVKCSMFTELWSVGDGYLVTLIQRSRIPAPTNMRFPKSYCASVALVPVGPFAHRHRVHMPILYEHGRMDGMLPLHLLYCCPWRGDVIPSFHPALFAFSP